jgi:hypothetical protein
LTLSTPFQEADHDKSTGYEERCKEETGQDDEREEKRKAGKEETERDDLTL